MSEGLTLKDRFELLLRRTARLGGIRLLVTLRQPWLARVIRGVAALWPMSPARRGPIRAASTTRSRFESASSESETFHEVIPARIHERTRPRTVGEPVHWKFRQRARHTSPAAFVTTLANGAVIGTAGAVMSADRTILGDVSLEWYMPAERHSLLFRPRLPSPVHLSGTVATLALVSGGAYYHWLVDVLPRIALLRRAGISLGSIDHFIVNGGNSEVQRWTLSALGIDMDRCLPTGPGRHYRANPLIVPSRCGTSGNPPHWVAEFLRGAFLPATAPPKRSGRIYISRRAAKYRRVLNEAEIVDRFRQFGFREVVLEGMSFREQVNLFAAAEAIAAPHGGGLTNIVFCQPGTKVLEFFSPHYVNECFWALGNLVGVDHYYLLGKGHRPPEGDDRQWGEWNMNLDLLKLDELLRLADLA